jgi:FKBP-type peptidyl-prolyl cis-trans isomerase (trigger factor)
MSVVNCLIFGCIRSPQVYSSVHVFCKIIEVVRSEGGLKEEIRKELKKRIKKELKETCETKLEEELEKKLGEILEEKLDRLSDIGWPERLIDEWREQTGLRRHKRARKNKAKASASV